MIEYVKGQIAELTPAIAIIDCHGVGYGLNISLNTFSALQGKQEAKLYVCLLYTSAIFNKKRNTSFYTESIPLHDDHISYRIIQPTFPQPSGGSYPIALP